jgi:hypothetical protein
MLRVYGSVQYGTMNPFFIEIKDRLSFDVF